MSGRGAPRKQVTDIASSWWREPDGTWRGKVAVGRRPNGSVAYKWPRARTERQIRSAVREIERDRDTRAKVWTAHDPTLEEWATRWLEVLLPLKNRSPKTINDYSSKLGKHVLPYLGSLRLSELAVEHFQDRYVAMARSGASGHVVHGTHRVVMSCLNVAVRQQVLATNPAVAVEVDKPREQEVEPFTPDDARRILAAAATLPRNRPRFPIAVAIGLRQGEALALTWTRLDLGAGVYRVGEAVGREPGRHGCGGGPSVDGRWPCGYKQGARCPQRTAGGIKKKRTKTRGSDRPVPLPAGLVEDLRAHRRSQDQERRRAGDLWHENDLIFPDEYGRPLDPKRDWTEWRALLKTAGVPAKRLHDARHTAATMLLILGVQERVVMQIMGWTEQRTATRYMHAVDTLRHEAAARVNGLLWSERSTTSETSN